MFAKRKGALAEDAAVGDSLQGRFRRRRPARIDNGELDWHGAIGREGEAGSVNER